MESFWTIMASALVALVIGIVLGYLRKGQDLAALRSGAEAEAKRIRDDAEAEARRIHEDARAKAEAMVRAAEIDARAAALKESEKHESELKEERKQLQELELRLRSREESLDKRIEISERREAEILRRDQQLDERERAVEQLEDSARAKAESIEAKLHEVASMSKEEAREKVLADARDEAKMELGRQYKRLEEEAKMNADRLARRLIAIAVQRYAGAYVTEKTVSVVNLPNEEMKGRIIGREGRNIRALEAALGVDIIIDDTPEAILLSSFNPFRREVARRTLERLIADGRIHPTRIEEVVAAVQTELESEVMEAGEQATFELSIHGIHAEILRLIGQLKYRTSYGQNQYRHSIEVAHLTGMMAAELGLNVKLARRAGLLHDVGKVIDESAEGSHAVIGAEFARKHGEDSCVVNAIASHHEDVPMESIYAVLVQAADALSGARPGARREMLESYIKRLESLEEIAAAYQGVDKAFAIQAGREVRIMVANNRISDAEAVLLSRDVARKIEEELTYPGQIKVTVIRETRAVDFAR